MVVTTATPDATPSAIRAEIDARLATAAALRPDGTVEARLMVAIDTYGQIVNTRPLSLVEIAAREVIRERLVLRLNCNGLPERMARDLVDGLPGIQS